MIKRQKIRKGLILFSFFLFPAVFYYLSPVLIIQASSEGVINGSFVLFILMFISSLFLGRAYCGWVCPGGGCQEAIFLASDKRVTRGDYCKWLIWVPWVGSISWRSVLHIVDGSPRLIYGRNTLRDRSLMGLKCFRLPVARTILFSTAVAAMIASPARNPDESEYSSM